MEVNIFLKDNSFYQQADPTWLESESYFFFYFDPELDPEIDYT